MQGFVNFTVVQRILLILSINFLLMSSAKCESKTNLEFEYLQKYPILSAPRITPLQDELILEEGSNFTLRCESDKDILWVKHDSPANSRIVANVFINANNVLRPHGRLLPLVNVSAKDVGTYYCVNKRSFTLADNLMEVNFTKLVNEYNAVGIYIYVKDKKNIIIAKQWFYLEPNYRWLIPCKPAEPSTEMLLTLSRNNTIVIANSTAMIAGEWKMPSIDGIIIKKITFNPREGFIVQSNDQTVSIINCTGLNSAHIESIMMNDYIDSIFNTKVEIFSDKGHYAITGESFNLTCDLHYKSNSEIKLNWLLPNNGAGIQYDVLPQRTSKFSDNLNKTFSIVTIKNAQPSYSGLYSCIISIIGEFQWSSYNMQIMSPSDSYLGVTAPGAYYVETIVNRSIHLVANVDGFPHPTIDWYNWKGEKMKASGKYHFTEEGVVRTLEIRSAKLYDAGIYTLKSSNGIEVRNLSYDVQVFDVPKVEMSDTYIRVNEEARLICRVTSNTPARVTFILTNCSTIPYWPTCFNTSERIVIKDPQPGDSNFEYLYVYNFSPTVPTKVRCVVSNMITPFEKPETANAYIFLSDFEPNSNMTVFRSDGHRELIKGDDMQFVCSAMVYHLATANLQWYCNDKLLKDEPGVSITSSSSNYTVSNNLTLSDIQVGNVTIECRAPYTNNLTSPMHVMHMEIIKDKVFPNITNTNINSTIIKYKLGDTLNLQCRGNGVPQPTVKWLKDGVELRSSDKVQFDADNSTLTIPFLGPQDEGTYKCVVSNRLGEVETYTELQISDTLRIPMIWLYGFFASCLGIIFLVMLLVYRMRRDRAKIRELKSVDLVNFAKGAVDLINPDLPLGEQAALLPYDRNFEFPLNKLKLGKQLGSGAFGVVFKAFAKGITEGEVSTVVAVKMVHQTADNEIMRALVSELKIMIHLGRHLNVVNLLGAVTKNIGKRELMMIIEYCPFGNLKDYLVANREHFVNQIVDETGEMDASIGCRKNFPNHGYENVTSSMRLPLSTCDLVSWAFQVARGMDYLASRKVVHGDLASRNILLCEDIVVKICDFGLARSLYKRTVYKKQGDAPLPIRWIALETFTDHVFSTYTDVWSFGVVLWELFSLGKAPYPDIGHENLFALLRDGYRMGKPQFASDGLYEVILHCWREEPTERPLFVELEHKLAEILGNEKAMIYVTLNEPFISINRNNLERRKMDYLSSMSLPCGASRQKFLYVNEAILCEGNTIREEACPSMPFHATTDPQDDRKPEEASSEAYHHYENLPMETRDLLTRNIDNPCYGLLELETSIVSDEAICINTSLE